MKHALTLLWPIVIIALLMLNPGVTYWHGRTGATLPKTEVEKNLAEELPTESAPEAATPEDPGEVKVVGPLANWMREEKKSEQVRSVPVYEPSERDHVVHVPSSAARNLLHRTFSVTTYASFEIQVPAGTVTALVTGGYESFTRTLGHDRRRAPIDVLLLDEGEFRDYVKGTPGSVTYAAATSSAQTVSWALNTDYKQMRKYYLVFANPHGRSSATLVNADFTVRFN